MAQFRVETVFDSSVGKFRVEVYYPSNATTPVVVSKPIYASHEHAMADSIEIFKAGIPDQPITAWREQ
jgi:hypothetical protein